jgi:hypothetical protein
MIRVTLHYSCGGCDARESVETWIKRQFLSFSGRDYGFGSYVFDSQAKLADETCPKDWIAFDPYTSATYCPKCWDEIESGIAETLDTAKETA